MLLIPQGLDAVPPPPPGFALAGQPFTLSVQTQAGQQATLTRPILVRLPLPPGRPVYPAVYRLFEGAWYLVPTAVDGAEVIAELRAGGVYALFTRPIPPDLPAVGTVSNKNKLWCWPAGAGIVLPALMWLGGWIRPRKVAN